MWTAAHLALALVLAGFISFVVTYFVKDFAADLRRVKERVESPPKPPPREPKFKYGTMVKVLKGFYKDTKGFAVSYYDGHYHVRIASYFEGQGHMEIGFHEDELEAIGEIA